ncbi:unnamed protein product [Phytophthora lilii]|uniref:Unnamed protein product n=1 Tax=Phytophthora lilii TaxID=2077276 RepID=A0A9W6XFA2_9STRA|nr:unnamed protein product [Phytophthora lilii]
MFVRIDLQRGKWFHSQAGKFEKTRESIPSLKALGKFDPTVVGQLISLAASNGNLTAVNWLRENPCDGCATNAINVAAPRVHLDVVKWLHDICLKDAQLLPSNSAAGMGYLEVVKWLHENRSEG